MNTLSLAARNLLRNWRRSLATLFAIAVGTVAILLFLGYTRHIDYGLQTGYVRGGGHLQIQRRGYFLYGSGNPMAYGIADYGRVIDLVRRDPVLSPLVTVVSPELEVGGIAGNFAAGASRTVLASGIVVEDRNRMRQWNDYGFQGADPPLSLTDTPPDAAVIGQGVARALQLCAPLQVPDCASVTDAGPVGPGMPADLGALTLADRPDRPTQAGARIEMLSATAHGAPNVASLAVVKAEDEGVKQLDDVAVTLHLPQAQRLVYGADAPQVTSILIQLRHTNQITVARQRLEQIFATQLRGADLEVQEFTTLNPYYGQALALFAAIFGFIAVLIGVIVLFTVGNTMSTAVLERTAEIGTLRAIGLRRGGIMRIFLCEGMLLGAAGAVAGVVASLVAAWAINHSGLTWHPPGRTDAVPLTLNVWGETGSILRVALGLIIVTVLSSVLPARRGARTNIVEALRHA